MLYVVHVLDSANCIIEMLDAPTLAGAYSKADAYRETYTIEIYLNGVQIVRHVAKGT